MVTFVVITFVVIILILPTMPQTQFPYCQLVMNSASTIVSNSNGLITDVIVLLSQHQLALCQNYFTMQPSYFLNAAILPCGTFRENQNSSDSLKLQTIYGRVLLVDCCSIVTESATMELLNPKHDSKMVILKFVQNVQQYVLQSSTSSKFPHVFVGELKLSDEKAQIYEVYRPTETGNLLTKLKFTTSLQVNASHQTDFFKNPLLSETSRGNFEKHNFRVAGVMDPNYAYDTDVTRLEIDPVTNATGQYTYQFHDSFAIEILRALELTMNFTVIPKVSFAWGHLTENKSWAGMIAQLLQNEIDLAISSTADRAFRHDVIAFNLPTSEIRLSAFFHKPKSISSTNTNGIIQPFAIRFWIALGIWLIVAGCTLVIFRRIWQRYLRDIASDTAEDFEESPWCPTDCFQWALSSLCMQSYYKIPTLTCYRIVIGIGYLLGVVIYSAYAGTLISFLSVVVEPIKNLKQLVASDFKFNVVDNPLPLVFLSESTNTYAKTIYERRKLQPKVQSMSEVVHQLNAGSFAFLVDHMNGYESLDSSFTIEEACDVRELEIPNARQKQGSMVNKNSTAKRIIDYQILRMLEYGLVDVWRRKYLQSKPKCDASSAGIDGVDIERIGLVYRLMLAGIGGALILLIIEICYTRKRKKSPMIVP